jgi:hypothetical protein
MKTVLLGAAGRYQTVIFMDNASPLKNQNDTFFQLKGSESALLEFIVTAGV